MSQPDLATDLERLRSDIARAEDQDITSDELRSILMRHYGARVNWQYSTEFWKLHDQLLGAMAANPNLDADDFTLVWDMLSKKVNLVHLLYENPILHMVVNVWSAEKDRAMVVGLAYSYGNYNAHNADSVIRAWQDKHPARSELTKLSRRMNKSYGQQRLSTTGYVNLASQALRANFLTVTSWIIAWEKLRRPDQTGSPITKVAQSGPHAYEVYPPLPAMREFMGDV